MVRLENDAFIGELGKLFESTRVTGSVEMTFKKYDGRTKPTPKKERPQKNIGEPTCLIRAKTTNKKKKISTVVHQKDVVKFQIAYFAFLKNNLNGLKKAKKVKKSKAV